jgi:large subunit ribosomal protein L18
MGQSKTALRRIRIKRRIRKTINGTAERPRLCVYRSNKEIYAQLVDDNSGRTLTTASSLKVDKAGKTPSQIAREVGAQVAQLATSLGVSGVVFDRNGYLYHGRVKELADAARENGLQF